MYTCVYTYVYIYIYIYIHNYYHHYYMGHLFHLLRQQDEQVPARSPNHRTGKPTHKFTAHSSIKLGALPIISQERYFKFKHFKNSLIHHHSSIKLGALLACSPSKMSSMKAQEAEVPSES